MGSTAAKFNVDERENLLERLHAHGQHFLDLFAPLPESPQRKRRKLDHQTEDHSDGHNPSADSQKEDEEDDNIWQGFGASDGSSNASRTSGSVSDNEDDPDDDVDYSDHDDEFRSDGHARQAEVIVFTGTASQQPAGSVPPTKSQRRAFMSSKVSKLRNDDVVGIEKSSETPEDDAQFEEERTNKRNDALLHRLVHTRLLSGSSNPELELTPAQRRKALAGRVQEITGASKLGKGEVAVRTAEMNHASKKVRLGLQRKKEERSAKELEEAKNLGNYHPTLKKLYETSSSGKDPRGKRERGLKMGVGNFSGGILKLRKDEIASVQGQQASSRGGYPNRGRGSGRGRGRGRGRR